ncbi:MAG: YfhO family protein [Ignavibacteria bacterium]|nr:YfhO family protein [Ignavibacteria bacterium]
MVKVKQDLKKKKTSINDSLNFLTSSSTKIVLIYIAIICIFLILFFRQGIFNDKVFASPDNLSPLSFKTFLEDSKAQGIFPLWVPYIFMGMPSYGSLATGLPAIHKIFSYIWTSIINAISGENLFFVTLPYYFVFAISIFFYVLYKFKNSLIALYASLTGVFATGIIQLIIVGHHTKMMVFAFFPLILLFIDKLFEENKGLLDKLFYFSVLTILLFLQISFNHIQMLFYSLLMIGIYIAFHFIYRLIKKIEIKQTFVSIVLIILALIFSFVMNADPILLVKEYNKYSIRGEPSIEAKVSTDKTDIKPLDYEYATNWSFSPGEMITFIIPYYYGFGNVEIDKGKPANLYWGQMPFTDSPVYFGVITLILAIIGIVMNFRKNISVIALTFIILFFLILSFGRTFPVLYNLFYYHVPFFSSFRAPVMIHYYMDFAFTILACFGLKSIYDSIKDIKAEKLLKITSYGILAIAIFIFLGAIAGCESSYSRSVLESPLVEKLKQQGYPQDQITQYAKYVATNAYKNVINDMLLHSILILIIITSIFLMLKNKINRNVLLIIIIIIGTFDIINISSKTLHWNNKSEQKSEIQETDYTKWLLSKEPQTYEYRIAQFSNGRLITSNLLAYHRLHLFNGYHGAKLRIYQDAIDIAKDNNPFLLGLCNVKYIISDKPLFDTTSYIERYKGSSIIYENKMFMPRAFFVDEYKVEKPIQILYNIKDANFNPIKTAFLEKDIGVKIDTPDSTNQVKILKFENHSITYEVNANGNNLLVFNEMYYPPDWKAYIDGQETEIYKTNYLQRSILVPKGKHIIELKYHSDTYEKSRKISLYSNLFILLVLIGSSAGFYWKRHKKTD